MVSAIVLAKNEEKNIQDCLHGLSWCDEVIVIDDDSTDRTAELAEKLSARVISRKIDGDFAAQRNFALEKAKGDWVLFVDADERVSQALWYEMMEYTNSPICEYSGFYVKRQDVLWGKELKHGETSKTQLLRLVKKGAGRWEGKVHEACRVKGKTLLLINPLMHYPHGTVGEFLKEINYYTDLRAKELYKKKVGTSVFEIVLFPASKFILNYVIRLGFLDGLQGLVLALMMSFHSFMVRAKLWQLSEGVRD